MTVGFLIIERKMLYAHSHTVLLHLLYIRHCHLAGQKRVFAHIFEITATERCTVDIHSRTQKHILLTVARLFSDRLSVKSRHFL